MRALYTQFSGLVGLLTFLNQLMQEAPLEKTVYVGLCAGLTVYVVLILGDVAIHRILESAAGLQQASQAASGDAAGQPDDRAPSSRPARSKAPDAPPVARSEDRQNKDAQTV
ncbi:hypothetical protein GQ464_003735 [Rhodocaloribacter litoris]|uniref:hypothetical protein n=1 Tax=Rhodocaloribacter litoris TaxID=2558931 RepID=UPI00141EDE71|nr:hypothetical protein [Rhodocaloribacter litoris]QXD16070.1 hypothetical protein GQ464_003735 [Rhodocaloribacter litoris]GIV59803.1 MAG: hypothetical protein KatS3mg043_0892 [Rhodothermaceae bacterium]